MKSSAARAVLRGLSRLAGNRAGQSVLEKCVITGQYLQGIGSGGAVSSSGERAVLSKLRAQSNSGERTLCIFDVGANAGQFVALACETLCDLPFHLHSFEPSREAYKRLQQTAKNNGSVTINNLALGDVPGARELFYETEGSQLASFSKRRLTHFGIETQLSENVRVETLDGYCSYRQIEYIDLLKMDVEGHELAVLNGATHMFEASRIRMVTFEFGGCNIDTRTFIQDFLQFFSKYGMQIARITPSGYFHELRCYKEILEQFRTTYFVCYRV